MCNEESRRRKVVNKFPQSQARRKSKTNFHVRYERAIDFFSSFEKPNFVVAGERERNPREGIKNSISIILRLPRF